MAIQSEDLVAYFLKSIIFTWLCFVKHLSHKSQYKGSPDDLHLSLILLMRISFAKHLSGKSIDKVKPWSPTCVIGHHDLVLLGDIFRVNRNTERSPDGLHYAIIILTWLCGKKGCASRWRNNNYVAWLCPPSLFQPKNR